MSDELKPIPGLPFPPPHILEEIEKIRRGEGNPIPRDQDGEPMSYRVPRLCEGCADGRHWDCGLQTWCECDCPGPDGDYYFPEEDVP